MKIEQRKVKEGRRTGVRTSGGAALLPQPDLRRTGPGGGKDLQKEEPTGSLSPSLPPRDGALFSSHLWIDVPSRLEDGFSCYLLNKVEL